MPEDKRKERQIKEKCINNLEERIEKREGYIEEQWEREEEDNS